MANKPSEFLRDYNTEAVPSSGFRKPVKSELMDGFQQVHIQTKTANYTTVASDAGTQINMDSVGTRTITMRADADVGEVLTARRMNTGTVQILAATGATIVNENSHSRIGLRYGRVSITCEANSDGASAVWYLDGSTSV